MPRNAAQNMEVRETRKQQILDAALCVYIRLGYHGTDMDAVAKEAGLAKGLIYYYYKAKNELFTELYTRMFGDTCAFSDALLESTGETDAAEQLMRYAYGMFCANKVSPRMMQFFMRVPFDAYAIFGPEQWKDGVYKSDMHRRALAGIIEQGIKQGLIPEANPSRAANSFWTVFVANCFEYSKLIAGTQEVIENDIEVFKDVVTFCFQGLGIEYEVWNARLERAIESNKGELINESI